MKILERVFTNTGNLIGIEKAEIIRNLINKNYSDELSEEM